LLVSLAVLLLLLALSETLILLSHHGDYLVGWIFGMDEIYYLGLFLLFWVFLASWCSGWILVWYDGIRWTSGGVVY
jgi:hypothetical protein